ncbi:hypothetical protein [Nonomuraea sp. NEAU-A123]|uniref:hypothetical protein n=1 Tax=Nonomuraea sp. NEAU-A123 TaxID=2839649 RepID=UPI001BE4458C|nr:hypothetical protein [Nonomuraea sp. NEAU-A123]MBT2231771.1 hypothetical protein [Nonomuraea sp. NEAU-A123]
MTIVAGVAGPYLRTLADGEVGARHRWITHIIDGLREHPDVELRTDGDWSGYDNRPVFKVRRGHRLAPNSLNLGHAAAAGESYEVFKEIRQEHRLDGVSFQVGIPGDLDLALFAFGSARSFSRRRPFRDALAREIEEIAGWGGQDVLFQLEVPVELVMVARAPKSLRTAAARLLVHGMVKQVAAAPPGTRFGVHLCVGDLNNKALKRLSTVAPVVSMVNRAAAGLAARAFAGVRPRSAGGGRPAATAGTGLLPRSGIPGRVTPGRQVRRRPGPRGSRTGRPAEDPPHRGECPLSYGGRIPRLWPRQAFAAGRPACPGKSGRPGRIMIAGLSVVRRIGLDPRVTSASRPGRSG